MQTFINRINFGQPKLGEGSSSNRKIDNDREKNITIALPGDNPKRNALTIIAGRNRTGKSHLLRNAEAAIAAHNASLSSPEYVQTMGASSSNVWVRPDNPAHPFGKCILVRDFPDLIAKFSTLGVTSNMSQKSAYERDINNVKNAFLKHQFFHSSAIQDQIGHLTQDKIEEMWANETSRHTLFSALKEEQIYKTNSDACDALRNFEALSSAKVYLRHNPKMRGMELVLRFGPSEAYSFGGPRGGWSQGQKVVCALFLLITYTKPEILLIDELENHLHPEYISKVCAFIKSNVRQAIIVTHHPHLIFSSFVDQAWFFEIITSTDTHPESEPFPTKQTADRPPPKRKIIELNNDFERIAATYNLFDTHDLQLLNLATACQAQITREMLSAIESGLTLQVAGSSNSNRPDTQSRELQEIIINILGTVNDGEELCILDFGAGKGRTFFEMQKTALFEKIRVAWHFYEPNPSTCAELRQIINKKTISNVKINAQIIEDIKTQAKQSFDIILAVNLLHECTPMQIAKILDDCSGLLKQNGKLIIAELYPLLTPERFGIGYTPADMVNILRCCGYKGFTAPIPMRSGLFSAYTCIATPFKPVGNIKDAAEAIRSKVWNQIQSTALTEYAGGIEMNSSRNAIKLASELHVLASIAAYDAGLWL